MQTPASKPKSSSSALIPTSEPLAATSGSQVSTLVKRPLPKGILKKTRPVAAEGDNGPDQLQSAETAKKTVTFALHEEIRYLTPPLSRSTSQASSTHSNKSQAGDDLASRSDSPSSSPGCSPPPNNSKMGIGTSKIPLFAPRSPSDSPEPEPELELRRGETPISPVKPAVVPFWEKPTPTPPISRTYGRKGAKSSAPSAASSRTVSAPSSPKRPPSLEVSKDAEKQKLADPTVNVEMSTILEEAQEAMAVISAASPIKPPSIPKARLRPVPTITAKAARNHDSSEASPFTSRAPSTMQPGKDFSPELPEPEPAPRTTPASNRSRFSHQLTDFPSAPSASRKPVSLDATPSSSSNRKRKHEALKPRSEGSNFRSEHISRNEDVDSNVSTPVRSDARSKRGSALPPAAARQTSSPYRESSGSGSEDDVDEVKGRSSRVGSRRKRRKMDDEEDGEYRPPPSSSSTPKKAWGPKQDDEESHARRAERQKKPPSTGATPSRRSGRRLRADSEVRDPEGAEEDGAPFIASSSGLISSEDFVHPTKAALRPRTLAKVYPTLNEKSKSASIQLYASQRRKGKSAPETPRKAASSPNKKEAKSAPTSSSKPSSSSARRKQTVESDSSSQGAYEVATTRSRAGTPEDIGKLQQDDAISVGSTVTLQGDTSRTRGGTEGPTSSFDHATVRDANRAVECMSTTQGKDRALAAPEDRETNHPDTISVSGDQLETTTAEHAPRPSRSPEHGMETCAAGALSTREADTTALDPAGRATLALVPACSRPGMVPSSSSALQPDGLPGHDSSSQKGDSENKALPQQGLLSGTEYAPSMLAQVKLEMIGQPQEEALPVKAKERQLVEDDTESGIAKNSSLSAPESSKMAAATEDEDEVATGPQPSRAEAATGSGLSSHDALRQRLSNSSAICGSAAVCASAVAAERARDVVEKVPSADSDMDISDGPLLDKIATENEVLTATLPSISPPRRSSSGPLRSARPKRRVSKPYGTHRTHHAEPKEPSMELTRDVKAPVSDNRSGYEASGSSGGAGSTETLKLDHEEPRTAALQTFSPRKPQSDERDSSGSPIKAQDPAVLPREGLSKTQRRYKAECWTQEQSKLEDSAYVDPEDGARSRKPSCSLTGLSYGSEMSAVPDSEISELEELDTSRFDMLQDAIDLQMPSQDQNHVRSSAALAPAAPLETKANPSHVLLKESTEHLNQQMDERMMPTPRMLSSPPQPFPETKETLYPPDMQRAQPDRIFPVPLYLVMAPASLTCPTCMHQATPNEYGCHDYPADFDRGSDKSKLQAISDVSSTAGDKVLQNLGQHGARTERVDTDASAILAACKEGGVRFPIECEDEEVNQPDDTDIAASVFPRESVSISQSSLSSSLAAEPPQNATTEASPTGVAQPAQAKAVPRGLDSLLQRGYARKNRINAPNARSTKASRSKNGQFSSGSQLSANSPLSTQSSELSQKSAASERVSESRRPTYKAMSKLAALHTFGGWDADQGSVTGFQQPSILPTSPTATATVFTTSDPNPRRKPSQSAAASYDTQLSLKPGISGSNAINSHTSATRLDEDGLSPPLKAPLSDPKHTVKPEKKVLSVSSRRTGQGGYDKKGTDSIFPPSLTNASSLPSGSAKIETRKDTALEQAEPPQPKRRAAKLRPANATRPPSSKRKLLTDDGENLPGEGSDSSI